MDKKIKYSDLENALVKKQQEMLGQVNLSNHQYIGIKQTFDAIRELVFNLATTKGE